MQTHCKSILLLLLGMLVIGISGCGNSIPEEDTVTELLQQAYSEYYGTIIHLKNFSVEYDNVEKIQKGIYQASATVTFTKDLTELRRTLESKAENDLYWVMNNTMASFKVLADDGLQKQLRGEKSLTETHILHIGVEYVGKYVKIHYDPDEFE